MKIKIDQQIINDYPDLLVGVVIAKNIDNSLTKSATKQLLDGIEAVTRKKMKKDDLEQHPVIEKWRDVYRRFGAKPKKHPSSIEALMKRVLKGDAIPSISTLVDVYNYLSVKNIIPIGGEDLDQVCGDICLTYAQGKEPFIPLGEKAVSYPPAGEAIYHDFAGTTCRRWNYRECNRTKFTKNTTNAAILIEDIGIYGREKLEKIVAQSAQFIEKYCGGNTEFVILGADKLEFNTGIEGKHGISDDGEFNKTQKIGEAKLILNELGESTPTANQDTNSESAAKAPDQEQSTIPNQDSAPAVTEPKTAAIQTDKEMAAPLETPTVKTIASQHSITYSNWRARLKMEMEQALEEMYAGTIPAVKIEYPRDSKNGDYSCNVAMQIAKKLEKSPRDVAEKIITQLGKVTGIDKIEVAGPGFLNFYVSPTSLDNEVNKIIKKREVYGESFVGDGKSVIVEYSQPNVAKPLGIHHLLSTTIGQIISNMHQVIGYNVIKINHIGDWGTQFGKLIHAYKMWGDKKQIEEEGILGLLNLYVKFHDKVEEELEEKKANGDVNPVSELEEKGRAEFRKLEEGNVGNRQLWHWFIDITMTDVNPLYKRLNVKFDEIIGESFYSDKMQDILDLGKDKGVFKTGEKGALICEFENPKIPTCLVQKADGASLYATRDLATVKYRVDRWHPEKLIYVVDVAQSLHFQQFFEIAKMLDLNKGVEMEHVAFGRMSLPDKKMSTRKGNVILLTEVLDEAVKRAHDIISEKSPDLTAEEKTDIAEKIGIGAIKYNILSQNRNTNITFKWEKMLAFEGNSAPYLQYTTARAHSILRKVDHHQLTPPLKGQTSLLEITEQPGAEETEHSSEVALKRMFLKYTEVLIDGSLAYRPNILTNYLFELAKAFNLFYNHCRVVGTGPKTQERREKLVKAALQILTNGLKILGIDPLNKM